MVKKRISENGNRCNVLFQASAKRAFDLDQISWQTRFFSVS